MSDVRDGLAALALTGTVAAAVIATSVWRRSWPLWLLGYVLMLVTAWVAVTFRAPPGMRTVTAAPAVGSAAWPVAARRIDVVSSSMPTPRRR